MEVTTETSESEHMNELDCTVLTTALEEMAVLAVWVWVWALEWVLE